MVIFSIMMLVYKRIIPQKKDRNDEEVTMSFVWQWDFVDDFSLFDPFGGL